MMDEVTENQKSVIQVIELNEVKVAYIDVQRLPNVESLYDYSALLVESHDGILAQNFVQKVRASNHERFYMIPIILLGPKDQFAADTLLLVDGCILSQKLIENEYETIVTINRKIDSIFNA